jgi:hypothetical protein|tara:strand:- start:829 stop:1434 length:606 start_codon:yes stop_codon:yes gene_type:complete
MNSLYSFIVKPLKGRYNNEKKIGDSSLLLNNNIESFRHVSKEAIVVAVPLAFKTIIKPGDVVIIHHNIFRRFYDMRGVEKNSSTYFKDDMYFASIDQIYMYQKDNKWYTNLDYCFVKPILEKDDFKASKEQKQIGILKYGNDALKVLGINPGDLVGFKPYREFEFIIDDERLYCMKLNDIIIKYERKGNEEEYNPGWAKSS